jgi:hypothetical protein
MAKPERQGRQYEDRSGVFPIRVSLAFMGSTVILVLPVTPDFNEARPFFVSGSLRGFNRSDTVMRQAASPDSKLLGNRIMVSFMRKNSRSMPESEKADAHVFDKDTTLMTFTDLSTMTWTLTLFSSSEPENRNGSPDSVEDCSTGYLISRRLKTVFSLSSTFTCAIPLSLYQKSS